MKKTPLPLLVAFGLIALIIVSSIMSTRTHDFPEIQLKITFVLKLLGGSIALLSAVLLLFRAAAGFNLRELLPLTLSLLAGALIMDFHWSLGVVIGAMGVAFLLKDVFASGPGPGLDRKRGNRPPRQDLGKREGPGPK